VIRRITRIEGRALPLPGNDIDTDTIIPARFLRSVSFDGMEKHVFEDERKAGGYRGTNRPHPFDDPRYAGASVMVVEQNFGCGSSREHAPQAIQRWGIQAIVGESFAEIFFGNSVMIGLPCVTAGASDLKEIFRRIAANPQVTLVVDVEAATCTIEDFTCTVGMPTKSREAFLTGAWDTTGMLLDRFDEVRETAARLPYLTERPAPGSRLPASGQL
jgi:3-isopropylmalate/(R)-2-methylmalate dehydratase small subunit